MKLEKGMWVAVVDGARGLVYVNDGTALEPQLKLVRKIEQDNPSTAEQGRDRPVRSHGGPSGQHGTFAPKDLHQKAEDTFVAAFAHALEADAAAHAFKSVVIVAPPVAMNIVRQSTGTALKPKIVREITSDYTKHSTADIAKAVVKALEG
ncbi:MAG: host attachment family protein [Hyphomicrobiaceae bacterium]|nr:host attachment protein [Hyphomicrobiaceae bacterium]